MSNRPATPVTLLTKLRRVRDKLAILEPQVEGFRSAREVLLVEGRALGILPSELAEAAGVTRGRVAQVAPAPAPEAPEVLRISGARTDDGTASPPRLDFDRPTLSSVATTGRRADVPHRTTVWMDLTLKSGVGLDGRFFSLVDDSPAAVLAAATATDAARVFLVGPPPEDTTQTWDSRAAAVRAWGLLPVEGWRVDQHYISDTDAPVFRWVNGHTGRRVEVLRTAAWFGEGNYTVTAAMQAWATLRETVGRSFPGATLMSTPSSTGRELWRRTIPAGTSYPVLSSDMRWLLHETAGQGRMELFRPTLGALDDLPAFTYLDGRFMYSALTWGMPVGEPTLLGAGHLGDHGLPAERLLRGRSRWLVTATVPPGWQHVGILMAPRDGGGWHYPSQPGETFTTWCDGAEAHLALTHGWQLQFHEGMTWREGKPLNTWTERLVAMWQELESQPLARNGVRAMLLFSIGAFAARGHAVTTVVPKGAERELPAGALVTTLGDQLVAEVQGSANAWSEQMAHPEWSALVWARARVRLLDGGGVDGQRTGALHLDPRTVLAFRTDALYTTQDPGWADDGRVGRFRVKGRLDGPLAVPQSEGELFALRDAAEGSL